MPQWRKRDIISNSHVGNILLTETARLKQSGVSCDHMVESRNNDQDQDQGTSIQRQSHLVIIDNVPSYNEADNEDLLCTVVSIIRL